MVESARCPSREELIRLTHGNLPGEQLEAVCDHLESCQRCQHAFSQLEDPPDEFARSLARITPDDLENARMAMEAETFKETATSVWDCFSSVLKSQDQQPTLSVPCQLGQYNVTRLIAHGGMGEVYEAWHVRLKRAVAVKVIRGFRQDDPVSHEHFLKEMETAGQLEHPNLVRAYDAWEQDGYLFLVQELLDGDSLQSLASNGKIETPAEIVDALLGACQALEPLHAKGFVHRDVKPANVMRLRDGSIKLIDFGLAIAADSSKPASRIGAGTRGYMSPEQASGRRKIDHRSDIYSTGRMLKYLLCKLPENAKNAPQSKLIAKLDELTERMTHQDPNARPPNISAVIVQLKRYRQQVAPVEFMPEPPPKAPPIPPPLPTTRTKEATANEYKQAAALAISAKPKARPKRRRVGWLTLVTLALAAVGFAAFQIVFKTDRQATVLVSNYQPDDILQLTSDDGRVKSVELGDQPSFVVDPGTYQLSLESPGNRRLNPASIKVSGPDQLTVNIEDRPAAVPPDPATAGLTTKHPVAKKELEPTVVDSPPPADSAPPSPNTPLSQRNPEFLSAPFSADDIRAARTALRITTGLSETIKVGLPDKPSFELEFVLIPPGSFDMGMPETLAPLPGIKSKSIAASRPVRRVTISRPFYLSRHEVTQKQFRDVAGGGLTPVTGDGTKYPATQIGWQPCVNFCNRLSASGKGIPKGGRLRLPTEAEWEYACRAGTTTHFWSGNEIGPREASLRLEGRNMRLEPNGSFQPNPFGLYDMHGNVADWCSDWFSETAYASDTSIDPKGPKTGTSKVLRGGGYSNPPFGATSHWRQSYEPTTRSGNIGLRPVLELPRVTN